MCGGFTLGVGGWPVRLGQILGHRRGGMRHHKGWGASVWLPCHHKTCGFQPCLHPRPAKQQRERKQTCTQADTHTHTAFRGSKAPDVLGFLFDASTAGRVCGCGLSVSGSCERQKLGWRENSPLGPPPSSALTDQSHGNLAGQTFPETPRAWILPGGGWVPLALQINPGADGRLDPGDNRNLSKYTIDIDLHCCRIEWSCRIE